uniref:Uncharacterized protein n=1 Tax=Noctiluca scintillans TaxID=2966 RepID=A0A7S1APJ6_NOCSC|mmetsp:Transcript_54814/g.146313  ORF Transcript_54814/g.146313 Transcript_54814/m.146313 type:complete len:258 (+) Transcript_54814:61-834(+)
MHESASSSSVNKCSDDTGEMEPLARKRWLARDTPEVLRASFARRVVLLVSLQIFLVFLCALPWLFVTKAWMTANMWLIWFIAATTLSVLTLITCSKGTCRKWPGNLLLTLALVVCAGSLVGAVSVRSSWRFLLFGICNAAVTSFMMTSFSFLTAREYRGTMPFIFGSMATLSTFFLSVGFFHVFLKVDFAWPSLSRDIICVSCFTSYLVYEIQKMLGEYGGHRNKFTVDDHMFAALNVYMDLMSVVLSLFCCVGNRV